MKKLLARLAIICVLILFLTAVFPGPAQAQAAHQAVLTWAAPTDAVAGTTYNVYRASGGCPVSGLGSLSFTKLNTAGIAALTYTDATLTIGTWCFYVTQSQNATESIPSNTAGGLLRPNTVTIQIVIS